MTAKLGTDSEIVLESKYAFDNRRAADLASDRRAEPKGSSRQGKIPVSVTRTAKSALSGVYSQ